MEPEANLCQGSEYVTTSMPFWHIDYFELKVPEKLPVQEINSKKQQINLTHERYPSCARRLENILITRVWEFNS